MRKLRTLPGLLLLAATAARSDPPVWLAQFDGTAGLYPEQVGWSRHILYGGAQRRFENGCLVLDSRASPGIVDYYDMYRPGLVHVDPGVAFLLQWRSKIEICLGNVDLGVGICTDEKWDVAFSMGYDHLESAYEPGVRVPFSAGVFHDFQLISTDLRRYALYVDSRRAIEGSFSPYAVVASRLFWGDGCQGPITLSRWASVQFGLVAPVLPGDLNCDGVVDFRDINAFVEALTDSSEYRARYPLCPVANGDVNADGRVDFEDINPFVRLLSGD